MPQKDKSFTRSLRLLWDSNGKFAIVNITVLVLRSLLPVLIVILLRFYINGVITTEGVNDQALPPAIITLISVIALAFLADDLLATWGYFISKKQAFQLELHISSLVHKQTTGLGLRFFEDPFYHDMLSRAVRDISWRPAGLISDLVSLFRGVISFIAMAIILWKFSFVVIAIIFIAFIPLIFLKVRNSERIYEIKKSSTPMARQASYFSWLLTGERPAREVKLFNINDFIEKLFIKNYNSSRGEEIREIKHNATSEVFTAVIKMAAFAGVIFYTSWALINSKITAGEMAMYLVAFRQAVIYMRDTVSGLSGLYENRLFLRDLFLFLDIKNEMPQDEKELSVTTFNKLDINSLSFTYPGSKTPAINDINISIMKGEKLAIVGPNGSGKTTLVKLLCRLYDPDTGVIKLNGEDIKQIDINSYRKIFSVVFQDFMLYYLSAAENIRMGDTSSPEDFDRIRESAKMAGIADFLEGLPEGYKTMLGHHTEGGRELSWGEWQKIAIARALYREAPVLVLDEPSSSLDADAEFEIFSRLGEISRGRTCILISHRLANVTEADKIIVLQNGHIAEAGTHEELMALKGLYFKMYTRQKTLYR